jgi:hypothetical protein
MSDEAYKAWLKKYGFKETPDYNLKAAFKAGITPEINPGDGKFHLSDQFKLPTHPTYSTDSDYSRAKGAPPAGRWTGSDKEGWTFYASPQNIKNLGGEKQFQAWWKENEPGVKLVLPQQTGTELPKNYRKGGRVKLI